MRTPTVGFEPHPLAPRVYTLSSRLSHCYLKFRRTYSVTHTTSLLNTYLPDINQYLIQECYSLESIKKKGNNKKKQTQFHFKAKVIKSYINKYKSIFRTNITSTQPVARRISNHFVHMVIERKHYIHTVHGYKRGAVTSHPTPRGGEE